MILLKEVVGAVLQGLTSARAEADAHSAEISKRYLEHELLRHFAVPQFGLQDVEISLRFAIAGTENSEIAVIIDHETLQKIDEKAISSLQFKAVPKNKKWLSFTAEDGSQTQELVTE